MPSMAIPTVTTGTRSSCSDRTDASDIGIGDRQQAVDPLAQSPRIDPAGPPTPVLADGIEQ